MSWKLHLKYRRPLSLRGKLLAVLLPGLLLIVGAELWLTRLDAIGAADAAFDRSLLGAIKSVDANITTDSGGLAVELPYRLFEFFQLTASGNVYFRVTTADGMVDIGTPDLPRPPNALEIGVPVFHDATYLGDAVRVGTYMRPLVRPLGGSGVQQLVIQVAEGVESRRAFSQKFVVLAAVRDVLVVSMIGVTLAVLITLMLRPVARLAAQVSARQPDDLRPLEQRDLPRDIQPLVDAVNQQLARTRALMDRQRQFIDDASHQLRTPLATLHAQVGYARRENDAAAVAGSLASIAEQLDHATRSTHQLLVLARADAMPPQREAFDLGDMVREVGTRLLPLAAAKNLDFGVECSPAVGPCEGERQLLAESLSNLAHNAINYTEPGGLVTLAAEADAHGYTLLVHNSGAPMPNAVVARLGERFLKGHGHSGSGLGLAIAKSIMERHGGRLWVQRSDAKGITTAGLWWPRKPQAHA